MVRRHLCLVGLVALAALCFRHALTVVIGSSVSVDRYSHILMVVPVSAALLYMEHKRILARVAYSFMGGLLYVAGLGAAAVLAHYSGSIEPSNYLSLCILLFAACCIAAFWFCYGSAAFRAATFPLLFLLLMAPMPDWMLDRTIAFLQNGSALVADWFFTVAGVPFSREGVVISLPTVIIEVAQECSGIRSSMILFLSSLVLAQLFLKSPWSRLTAVLLMVPMTIFKNGLRIFTLAFLGTRVDPSFLTGRLHHQGGIVFFAISFVLMWGLVWALQKWEARAATAGEHPPSGRASTARSF